MRTHRASERRKRFTGVIRIEKKDQVRRTSFAGGRGRSWWSAAFAVEARSGCSGDRGAFGCTRVSLKGKDVGT